MQDESKLTGSNSSEQSKMWAEFYEGAWEARRKYIAELIAGGETEPNRVLNRLALYESANQLVQENGEFIFESRENKKTGTPYPTGKPIFKYIAIEEQVIKVPFYSEPMDFLSDLIDSHHFDAIVELGSGLGTNIFKLHSKGAPKEVSYYAGEYTESGVESCKMLAKLLPEMKINSFHFDYKNPDLGCIKEKGNILVFSCHSIEQVNMLPTSLFSYLAGLGDQVTGVHFEPFGHQFQLKTDTEVGQVSKAQAQACGKRSWNMNFMKCLFDAEKEAHLKISFLAKNTFAGDDVTNPTSLAMWHSL